MEVLPIHYEAVVKEDVELPCSEIHENLLKLYLQLVLYGLEGIWGSNCMDLRRSVFRSALGFTSTVRFAARASRCGDAIR